MYEDRLKDCFVILGLAHKMIEHDEVKEQLKEVASRYKGIVHSSQKLTKKRVEKLEIYIDSLPSFNKKTIIENGVALLKKI